MSCATAQGVEVSLVPARASGTYQIVGNEILLDGAGQQVVLDIFISDWDPTDAGLLLSSFQAVIEPAGFSSGLSGVLTPFRADCVTSADCVAAIGQGGVCSTAGVPANKCPAGFIIRSREDFLFRGISALAAVDIASISYRYAGLSLDFPISNTKCVGGLEPGKVCRADGDCPGFGEIVPPGTCEINHDVRYAGTLVLDVPVVAKGKFTIELREAPGTQVLDDAGAPFDPLFINSARITILCDASTDCEDGNACTKDDCLGDGTCLNAANYDINTQCCNPADGTVLPISDSIQCTQNICDPDTGLVTHPPEPEGTTCGDSDDTECNGADTCDGAGACQDNLAVAETTCGDSTDTECNLADACDGAGACQDNLTTAGTPCGDTADTDCTAPDACDGTGDCLPNDVADGTGCDDGLFCNENEACAAGACTGGNALNCDDGIACTTDTCNDDLDKCDNDLLAGRCVITGVCYADGEFNPANDCQECDTASSTTEWSFREAGGLCDDGDACTGTGRNDIGFDTCDGAGTCTGTPDPECNDNCVFAISAVEGVTLSNNDDRSADDAEALCQPDSNNDIWFVYTAACDGEVFLSTTGSLMAPSNDPVLNVFDRCPDTGGVEIACDDDSGVNLQAALTFVAAAGWSYRIRVAGFENNSGDVVLNIAPVNDCVIDGVCYAAGQISPGNECEACVPQLATDAWSARLEGSSCGDGAEFECDNPDACDGAGVCEVNFKPDGTACSDEGNECTFDECSSGVCSYPPRPEGTPCGDPTNTECDNPDTCNGASACRSNPEVAGAPCGDRTGTECDLADICTGAGSCDDNLAPNGTECDDVDVCTGNDLCTVGLCAGTSILEAPIVVGEGSKFLFVTPQPTGAPAGMALLLTSPTWPCVAAYITAEGELSSEPVFQTPAEWDTIRLGGGLVEISPSSEYEVVAECGEFVSTPGSGTTVQYGDVAGPKVDGQWADPEGIVDVMDWLAIIGGFLHDPSAPAMTRTDLYPCAEGDKYIDIRDVLASILAFLHTPYPCPLPCP